MLILFPAKDIVSLKNTIQLIWESIPKTVCENIIKHLQKRWELFIKFNGRRIDRELLKKIPKVGKDFEFKLKSSSIKGVRISYNDKFIIRLKNSNKRKEKNTSRAKKKRKKC